MTQNRGGTRRPLVSVDAKGYGVADGRRQAEMQRGLVDVLAASAEAAGLRRSTWECQPGGDGEFAVLPADEPEDVLVDGFVRELHARLDAYNEDRVVQARLRLRMAIHNGVADPASNGYSGAGAVVVSRLVGSPPARAAQVAAPDASLVVIVSNRVFLDIVAQGHTVLRPARFRRVEVRVKEYTEDAWLYVPGHDVHGLDLNLEQPDGDEAPEAENVTGAGSVPPKKPRRSAGRRTYKADAISIFEGPVDAGVIGINKAPR
jgi:hypothetical protein